MKFKLKNILLILALLGLSSCVTDVKSTSSSSTEPIVSPTTITPSTTPSSTMTQPTLVPTTTTTITQPTTVSSSPSSIITQPTAVITTTATSVSTTLPTQPTTTSIKPSSTITQPTIPTISSTKPPVSVPTITTTTTSTDPVVKNYYANVNTSLQGEAFVSELTELINEGYVRKSYDQAYTILTESDCDLTDPSKIVCFYTGVTYPKGTSGNNREWNREHTWAKSHGFKSETYDAYSDCHHLRATEMSINSTRGSLDFDEVENYNSSYENDSYGNKWINGTCFEPRDEVKGDVARIMLYMVTKYNDSTLDLSLVDSIPTSGPKFGKYSTLLKWHYEDPVSEAEIYRNNVVYSYQKNRNPYIDHPEYVDIAFPNSHSSVDVDDAKVSLAEQKIAALPNTATLDNKATILDVKSYIDNNLNYAEIAEISNYSKLTNLLAQIEALEPVVTEPDPVVENYSYTFSSQIYKGNNETHDLNGISWTLSGTYTGSGYWGWTNDRGEQFGAKKSPYTNLVFESENISNKITKIVIETCGASGIEATLTASVGGVEVGSANITTESTEYTFTVNSLSGEVKFNFDATVGKAIYIKTIKIYC